MGTTISLLHFFPLSLRERCPQDREGKISKTLSPRKGDLSQRERGDNFTNSPGLRIANQ